MRPLWKGSISFGLVNIPVKMYTASQEKEFKFKMLHKKDLSEIRYSRICKVEEKEVPWAEIVKGYEYAPGEYVILSDEDFENANLEKSKTIEILHFINEDEINTVFYSKPYFLEPDKTADKAYTLLLDALKKSKKVGIAKFVLHNREHLAVIKPYENAIILNELRYANELKHPSGLDIPEKGKSSAQELSIALKLIDQLTTEFKPNEYKDTYTEEMKKVIEKKAKGKKITPKGQEIKKPTKVHDIMSLLKASLDDEKKPKKTTTKKRKHA
jgi:DNA end-binding protein Ku